MMLQINHVSHSGIIRNRKRGLILGLALAVIFMAQIYGCKKGTDNVVTSCHMNSSDGKLSRCIEYHEPPDRKKAQEELCGDFEVAGGKAVLRDGACPTKGSLATCTEKFGDQGRMWVRHAYSSPDIMKQSCRRGTFKSK